MIGLFTLAMLCFMATTEDLSFTPERWKHPTFGWDRWRMLNDTRRVLTQRMPSEEEAVRMLGPAAVQSYGDETTLRYGLGTRPSLLPHRVREGKLVLHYQYGRYTGCEVHADVL